jgi:hypothetical protein
MNCVLYEPENMLLNTSIVPSGKPASIALKLKVPKRYIWRQFHSFFGGGAEQQIFLNTLKPEILIYRVTIKEMDTFNVV